MYWDIMHKGLLLKGPNNRYTTYLNMLSIIEANTKKEALRIFNILAEERKCYPYFWNKVSLENIFLRNEIYTNTNWVINKYD